MTEYRNDARIDRVGTVRKLGDAYFVKLVEPVSEPWHLMWSEGPQQVSGWQDDETMTSAVEVGYAPILECVPGAATQTAEQAQPAEIRALTAQRNDAQRAGLKFVAQLDEIRAVVAEWQTNPEATGGGGMEAIRKILKRPGSPVTETTTQDGADHG